MRPKLILAITILFSCVCLSQNGINYKANISDGSGNIIANQSVAVQFTVLDGATNVYQENHSPTTNDDGLIIINIGEGTPLSGTFAAIDWSSNNHFLNVQVNIGGGLQDLGTSAFKTVPYALNAANITGLEALDEGNGNGWRLKGQDPTNYGEIGNNAMDLSISNSASTIYGATGFYSTAMGNATEASGSYSTSLGRRTKAVGESSTAIGVFTTATGENSTALGSNSSAGGLNSIASGYLTVSFGENSSAFGSNTVALGDISTAMGNSTKAESYTSTAIGRFNIGGGTLDSWITTDPLFEVGNGADDANRSNALTILKNGTITAPSFDIGEITDNKALITKEYYDAGLSSGATGLEAIDEGNGIGWRLKGQAPANYGNLGDKAVDLSYSQIISSTIGATGDFSTAIGVRTKASGGVSTAMGLETTASGSYSTAMGEFTTASGIISTAMGLSTKAESHASMALGRFNVGGGTANSWVETDPLLEVGNGSSGGSRSNALTILKNGTILAPTFDTSEITDNKALITKEYADVNLGGSGLEAVDEGNGNGWRLINEDPNNHGDTGLLSVNLSNHNVSSITHGATGDRSTALGFATTASGDYSTAIGSRTIASGSTSTAMGTYTEASTFYATAMGNHTIASGNSATAMGYYTTASGLYSMSIGSNTKAEAGYSTSIGRFNIGGGTAGSWNPIDPVFEIGNGLDDLNRDNALTVLKNGKVGIGEHQPNGFLEVNANTSATEPNINLIHQGSTGARINFSNTATTNGNVWTLYGDTNDTDANSVFNIFHPNAGNIVRIQGDGEVGINGVPNADFHVFHGNNGSANGMKLQNSSDSSWWRFYVSSSSDDLRLFSASQGTTVIGTFDDISGAYTSSSDRRLKKNFKELHFNWTDFMKLETLSYNYKVQKDTKKHIGLVAQDVAPIYPELVNYNSDEDVYHLNYSGIGVVAIKAAQELKKEVDTLKDEVGTLKKANADLKQKLNKLEQIEARLAAIETNTATSSTKDVSEANMKE